MALHRDPDEISRLVRIGFESQGIMKTLGAKLISVDSGQCEITAPITTSVSQQHGFSHAGLAFTIGDSAAGFAAFTLMAPGMEVLTTEMKIHLLAPAAGDFLIARGSVIRAGRTLSVAQSKVFVLRDGVEKQVALLLGTLIAVPQTNEDPSCANG